MSALKLFEFGKLDFVIKVRFELFKFEGSESIKLVNMPLVVGMTMYVLFMLVPVDPNVLKSVESFGDVAFVLLGELSLLPLIDL